MSHRPYPVYYDTKASLPMLEAGIIQYTNALGVLMGLYPWDVREIMETRKPLPEYIETIGIGIPANLLLRRPDIRRLNAGKRTGGIARRLQIRLVA